MRSSCEVHGASLSEALVACEAVVAFPHLGEDRFYGYFPKLYTNPRPSTANSESQTPKPQTLGGFLAWNQAMLASIVCFQEPVEVTIGFPSFGCLGRFRV